MFCWTSYKIQYTHKMAEVDQLQHYILLQDKTAEKREKYLSSFSRSEKKFVSLHKGEILTEVCEKDQPKEQTIIKLHPVERPSLTVECTMPDVQRIDKEEANLLLPLCSLSERLRVSQERNRLRDGKKMGIKSNIYVTVPVKTIKKQFPGVVMYKGPLPGHHGTMFGVELLLDGVRRGSTDGEFKGKHYFQCPKDSGMFVSLERLELRNKDTKDIKKMRKDSKHNIDVNGDDKLSKEKDKELSKGKNKDAESLKISTSVKQSSEDLNTKNFEHKEGDTVWVFINDKPKRGVLKYIGRPPGAQDLFAGIQMDIQCGKGNGEYYGKQLFKCPKDYAHFTPAWNVISAKQFCQMHLDESDDSSSLKEKFLNLFSIQKYFASKEQQPSSTRPTSCDDIVQMESKFSNVSGNYVIKEQEELLRKAKAQKPKDDQSSEKETKKESALDKGINSTKHDYHRELINKNSIGPRDIKDSAKENLGVASRHDTTSKTVLEKSHEQFKTTGLNNGHYSSNLSAAEYTHRAESTSLARGFQRSSSATPSHLSENQPNLDNDTIHEQLEVGSMVEVLSKITEPKYGVIRWIGLTPNVKGPVAGLELEEEMEACSDGTFSGKRHFHCPNRRGLFVLLRNCRPDSRFGRGRSSLVSTTSKRLSGTDFGNFESPVINDQFVPPADSLEIYLAPPQRREDSKRIPRGIQGHHNSCYLDATLFAIFAFSSVMDSILLRPKGPKDIEQYEKVQNVLRDNIVYPLRSNGFVRADRVFELRQLLDRLGTVTGLVGEEKDPEEFLMTLLHQVLKAEPFLKIKLGSDVRKEYFYQVLADKDVERPLPCVEELLKRSLYQSNLKLTEVPSCLIVQMPRFGKGFKMYTKILPSLTINIGALVDNAPQDCAICGKLATFNCNECCTITGTPKTDCSGNYCKDCNPLWHSHAGRSQHKYRPLRVSPEICAHYANRHVEHQEMELFAIVCIETSHYVTFAKCPDVKGESRWCFFDSMADRIGSKNGYNIPCVTECNEVVEWLSSEKENRDRIIEADDKEMPEKVRRILGDAYMCLYQSVEISMYK